MAEMKTDAASKGAAETSYPLPPDAFPLWARRLLATLLLLAVLTTTLIWVVGCAPRQETVDRAVAAPEFARYVWRERLAPPESASPLLRRK